MSTSSVQTDSPVILLIGACALDRLVTVSSYPTADSKIRSTSYNEVGGGNAANTASAIGKIVDAKLFCSSGERIRVQLLSKVGDDAVAQNIITELSASNVETSNRLFQGGSGSTTSFTTVIVDEKEQTRTCIHTPGSCGELSLQDVQSLSQDEIDELFANVIHLHSDSRQTDVSLWMAKEAKERGITVSLDCEKDRNTKALDQLLDLCDILFTNSNYLGEYLDRLTCEKEAATDRRPLSKPTITLSNEGEEEEEQLIDTYIRSLTPSMYFARWQQESAIGKQVVVTHGSMGALHFKQIEYSKAPSSESQSENVIEVVSEGKKELHVRHSFDDGGQVSKVLYEVRQVGILKDATVVDTTGAGDAFIGGYILTSNMAFKEEETVGSKVQIALETGSFVGGRKVGGPGARTALPTAEEFDSLGSNAVDVKASLKKLLGFFNDA
eukprot:CAMPEP_0197265726 /NCGR_PEP_ID=MMETSP1432-20130617/2572_1 /TAXON_ID=44447 /ORGANISM="Pseudo-nitzschia delicatissima, Strain UNC1205" /LENGTH=439 /DNA_ID=CAMNT_0042730499 /DNA_START=104 /DNA_END=1420 /DNA_ORIENTATION=+